MTTWCDDVISAALADVSDDWICRPLDTGWLLITTSHQYSDGDYIELLVRRDDTSVVVSDGGEALARLELAGVSIDGGRAKETWHRLLRAHELEVNAERLTVHGTLNEMGSLVNDMANAVANIDGLRLLAPPPRRPRFADRLITFLQGEFEYVREGPQLHGHSGVPYKATAAVGDPNQETFVQAVAGESIQTRQRAIEHVYTMFSDVNGALPKERKLVILNEGEWKPEQTRLLSIVAYVGSWSYREQIVSFVHDPTQRKSRILMPVQEQVPFE